MKHLLTFRPLFAGAMAAQEAAKNFSLHQEASLKKKCSLKVAAIKAGSSNGESKQCGTRTSLETTISPEGVSLSPRASGSSKISMAAFSAFSNLRDMESWEAFAIAKC